MSVLQTVKNRIRKSLVRLAREARRVRAIRHRKNLGSRQMKWIGVTGSCGKTTTTEILYRICATRGECRRPGTANLPLVMPICVLRVSDTADYVVQEIGITGPGDIGRNCEIFRPEVGVVTNVGTDHYTQFKDIDAIAREKADLVRALPASGLAVLNADDSRVLAMRDETDAGIVTYGTANQEADYLAFDVESRWPDKLCFGLRANGHTYQVATQFLGEHFLTNVLAAIACANAVGIEMDDILGVLEQVVPLGGRMSESEDGRGVFFVRDDYKAPWWGLEFTADFVRSARATRKILVLGEMSDNPGNKKTKFSRFINGIKEDVDRVVVVGPTVSKLTSSLKKDPKVSVFYEIEEASSFLDQFLEKGDLVVLKSRIDDHLERLYHHRVSNVNCWQSRCGRKIECRECDQLN